MNRLASLAIVLAVAASLAAGGCTTHGDGGRCDSRNGNADCDNGLQCVPAQLITLPEAGMSGADICCMMDRNQEPAGSICALTSFDASFDVSIDVSQTEAGMDVSTDQSSPDASDASSSDASDAATDG